MAKILIMMAVALLANYQIVVADDETTIEPKIISQKVAIADSGIVQAQKITDGYLIEALKQYPSGKFDFRQYFHPEGYGDPGGENFYYVIVSSDYKVLDTRKGKDKDGADELYIDYEFHQIAEVNIPQLGRETDPDAFLRKTNEYYDVGKKKLIFTFTMRKQNDEWLIYTYSDENIAYLPTVLKFMQEKLNVHEQAKHNESANSPRKDYLSNKEYTVFKRIYRRLLKLQDRA